MAECVWGEVGELFVVGVCGDDDGGGGGDDDGFLNWGWVLLSDWDCMGKKIRMVGMEWMR